MKKILLLLATLALGAQAPPVQVLVRDAFTNPVAGTSVSLALVGTGVLSEIGRAHV